MPSAPSRRRRARQAPEFRQSLAAATCALVALTAQIAPVGSPVFDGLWAAGIAAAVAFVATTSKRGPLLLAAGLVALTASSLLAVAIAIGSGVFAGIATRRLQRQAFYSRGVAGGLAAVSVMASSHGRPWWFSVAVSVVLVALIVRSGFTYAGSRNQRRITQVAVVVGGAVVLAAGLAVVGVVGSRSAIDRGTEALSAGLSAARDGDTETAARELDTATRLLESVRGRVDRYGFAAKAVPGVAQHVNAISYVLGDVGKSASLAEQIAVLTDPSVLSFTDGRIDLETIAGLEQPLARLGRSLEEVIVEVDERTTAPLVPTLSDRLERLREDALDAASAAETGSAATAVLPSMLGRDGPVRYLILFTSPAEARGRFGFPGSFAEVVVDRGQIDLREQGTTSQELFGIQADQSGFDLGDPLLRPYVPFGPTREFRSVTIPPDFRVVAANAIELWAQSGREPVDAVVRFDPASLAALLDFTGPVNVDGLAEALTAETLESFLVYGQYVQFPDDQAPRREVLDTVAETTFDRLETADLPGPQTLADRFAPVVAGGHLQMMSMDEEVEAFLVAHGLAGVFDAPDSDSLLVTNINSTGNKVDTFLRRAVRYDAVVADGILSGTVQVTLRNEAPLSGLPFYVIGSFTDPPLPAGTNRTTLAVYTAVPAQSVSVDGVDVPTSSTLTGGRYLQFIQVDLAPGQESVVELHTVGPVPPVSGVQVTPGGGVTPDEYAIEVTDDRVERSFDFTGPVLKAVFVHAAR